MRVISLFSIESSLLLVYYTSWDCYKFSIVDSYGCVFESTSIFYTSEAAEKEGRIEIYSTLN